MMEPLCFAKLTSLWSWFRVAAVPVGLLGEHQKMMSVRGVFVRSGKKSLEGEMFMYTMLSCFPVCSWNSPACPRIMLESTYAWKIYTTLWSYIVYLPRVYNIYIHMTPQTQWILLPEKMGSGQQWKLLIPEATVHIKISTWYNNVEIL